MIYTSTARLATTDEPLIILYLHTTFGISFQLPVCRNPRLRQTVTFTKTATWMVFPDIT